MKWGVFCLGYVVFCVTYWNKDMYSLNSEETHTSYVCFQHTKHDQTFYLIWLFAC